MTQSKQALALQTCAEDAYQPSDLEVQWAKNVANWTGPAHCSHIDLPTQEAWVVAARKSQAEEVLGLPGQFPEAIFSKICRAGQPPSFIEPLAGILRDPRFGCNPQVGVFSKDWLAFPPGHKTGKRMFFDAGGSRFMEALDFFTKAYQATGTTFDAMFVWEAKPQGTESYWNGASNETRSFWEPRVTFYDGIPVTANQSSANNPVSRMFSECKPEDYCVFKLDIDTPSVELPLINQLIGNPQLTSTKVDEVFFEHHVEGVMQKYWGANVNGTFATSYNLFGTLRQLGVRAHSWV